MFLTEATERRTSALERQTNPSQLPTALITLDETTSYRRIEEAFHCKLKGPVVVDKKTLVALQNFQTVCSFDVNVYGPVQVCSLWAAEKTVFLATPPLHGYTSSLSHLLLGLVNCLKR